MGGNDELRGVEKNLMPLAQDVTTWDFDEDAMNSVRRDKVLLLWLLICLG